MKQILLLLIVVCSISGCRGKIFSDDSFLAPKPFRMGKPNQDANPTYLKGWDDGCKTGLSTMVYGAYKSFYAFKQDPTMINNKRYYQAWKDAYTYCRHYSFRFIWDGLDSTPQKDARHANPLCVFCY